jgi:hypothetical protein
MNNYKDFATFLQERVLSIGLKPEHEKFREAHRQEIHHMLHHAYKDIGGYAGHKSGSPEESHAIHKDIDSSIIKATKRDGKITSVNLYRHQHGRKSIASATDSTPQGKADWTKTKKEDIKDKRSWGEVSGKPEHIMKKLGAPVIPNKHVAKLTGKEITPDPNGEHYTRKIGGHAHRKVALGFPKETK